MEKAKNKMELRHRIRLDYSVTGKPIKPFVAFELTNTLNEPTSNVTDSNGDPLYGGQYLNSVRAMLGFRWKINMHNALTFSYCFHLEQDREVNIGKNSGEINRLYMEKDFKHVIHVAYELGY